MSEHTVLFKSVIRLLNSTSNQQTGGWKMIFLWSQWEKNKAQGYNRDFPVLDSDSSCLEEKQLLKLFEKHIP